jgi:hypothetical protein
MNVGAAARALNRAVMSPSWGKGSWEKDPLAGWQLGRRKVRVSACVVPWLGEGAAVHIKTSQASGNISPPGSRLLSADKFLGREFTYHEALFRAQTQWF